jgi:carnitine O-acetyltransferase
MTYEHSPAEGPPLMVLTDHILAYTEGKLRHGSNLPALQYSPPTLLDLTVTEPLVKAISEAAEKMDALAADLDLALLHFTHWGTTEIKALGFSPDSFIQTALQLAFHRVQGEVGAHYESGGTRQFLHGRTEVIRSCSLESREFCEAMAVGRTDALVLMKAAIQAHNSYAKLAVAGLGVDRHMQGLKLIAAEAGMAPPAIFSDPGYLRSGRMRISSSQVSGASASFLCFGPLVADGYGVCYNPRAADMLFPCSALRSCTTTSALAFRVALESSLLDMRLLALAGTRAKL